jgi:hypothetical protein
VIRIAEALSRRALAALDMSVTPVIISNSPGEPSHLNRAAKDLIAQLVGGFGLIEENAARTSGCRPSSRDLPVELVDGRTGSLRVQSRRPFADQDTVVAVLSLSISSSGFDNALWAALSARERQVCELVIEGHTDREIAERLLLSRNTAQYGQPVRQADLRQGACPVPPSV